VETSKAADSQQIAAAISLEAQHTAEEVPVLATGPGSVRVHGFISNTDIFHIYDGGAGLGRSTPSMHANRFRNMGRENDLSESSSRHRPSTHDLPHGARHPDATNIVQYTSLAEA